MMLRASFALLSVLLPLTFSATGADLTALQEKALNAWIAQNANYRIANDMDCNCSDDIQQVRSGYNGSWRAVPDYHPYKTVGDFNGDGIVDFAVVLIDKTAKHDSYAIAVFNGSSNGPSYSAAFFRSGLDLKWKGLFYGPPRPKPYRLILGPFEAEGIVMMPHGNSYQLK